MYLNTNDSHGIPTSDGVNLLLWSSPLGWLRFVQCFHLNSKYWRGWRNRWRSSQLCPICACNKCGGKMSTVYRNGPNILIPTGCLVMTTMPLFNTIRPAWSHASHDAWSKWCIYCSCHVYIPMWKTFEFSSHAITTKFKLNLYNTWFDLYDGLLVNT